MRDGTRELVVGQAGDLCRQPGNRERPEELPGRAAYVRELRALHEAAGRPTAAQVCAHLGVPVSEKIREWLPARADGTVRRIPRSGTDPHFELMIGALTEKAAHLARHRGRSFRATPMVQWDRLRAQAAQAGVRRRRTATPPGPPHGTDEWPLAERARLVGAAWAALDRHGAALIGAGGVGKTRLARELARAEHAAGTPTWWIVGSPGAREVPFGALAAVLPRLPGIQREVIRSAIELFGTPGPNGLPLIVVDDAHLLDESTGFVIHQLMVHRRARVLLTVRDDEPIPETVCAIVRSGELAELPVPSLTVSGVGEILAKLVGSDVDPDLAERIWCRCRGNPLQLRRLVDPPGRTRPVQELVLAAGSVHTPLPPGTAAGLEPATAR